MAPPALSCFVTSLWVSLSVSMSCAEAVSFQLVMVVWFCCMFVWVCSHVIRLGYHADFIQLLVRVLLASRICASSSLFCNEFPFAGGFMSVSLLSHGLLLLLHFCHDDIRLVSAGQLST